jgi:hypothetical protein
VPATPSRIGFIIEEWRKVRIEDATVRTNYGKLARESDDPVETFFDSVADATTMANARMTLLGTERRRFPVRAVGLDEALALDLLTGVVPVATFTDTEKAADLPCAVAEFGIDFAKQQCLFTLWG